MHLISILHVLVGFIAGLLVIVLRDGGLHDCYLGENDCVFISNARVTQ